MSQIKTPSSVENDLYLALNKGFVTSPYWTWWQKIIDRGDYNAESTINEIVLIAQQMLEEDDD